MNDQADESSQNKLQKKKTMTEEIKARNLMEKALLGKTDMDRLKNIENNFF